MTTFTNLTAEFPTKGEPGITHEAWTKDYTHVGGDPEVPVNTTVMRDANGTLIGIVKQFPNGRFSPKIGTLLSGEFFVSIRPSHQRKGLGLELLRAADQQWGLNFMKQHYTHAGRRLVDRYRIEKYGR